MNHRILKVFTFAIFLAFIAKPVVFASPSQIVETTTPTNAPVISGEVLGTVMTKKVDYLLPYPGILMDNPLYVLKQLRDFILERLIVDPIRKAEFYILQADKFVNMTVYMSAKGKTAQLDKPVTQAEKNINLAVTSLIGIKGNGVAIPARVTDRLEKALAKYIEVFEELLPKVDASQKETISAGVIYFKKLQGELPKLK